VSGPRARTLLAFLSSSCATCRPFWESFAEPATLGLPGDMRLVVVTQGAEHESPAAIAELAGRATVVMSSQAWADYAVPGAPYFVLVAAGHVNGEGTGVSWAQVRRLLAEATGDVDFAAAGGHTVDLRDRPHQREERIDDELLAAGVHPGHSSLYEDPRAPNERGAP
jgi:hypothetical protein